MKHVTESFSEFMRQYKMTGSEKADGYNRDVFIGLTEHEKEEVFKLLMTELPWSVEWIFLLDPEKAITAVKVEEQKMRGDPYEQVHLLQQQLLKYTGDLAYQQRMIEDYPHYIDRLKPPVVDSIAHTPTNEAKFAFLEQVIATEVNTTAVARAVDHLLYLSKTPKNTDEDERGTQAA